MKFKQVLIDFFFGAIREDRELAKERGEEPPLIQPWQLGVIGLAIIAGIGIIVRALLPE